MHAVSRAIRKILVPVHRSAGSEAALMTALLTARVWNAHVTVLHVVVDVAAMAGLAGEGLAGAINEEIIAETKEERSAGPGSVRTLFERAIDEQGVLLREPKPGQHCATASFTVSTGQEEELVAEQARLADLTVVPHPQSAGLAAWVDVLHAVLFNSGRPVLLAPERCPKSIGERICVAWNGTAESASGVAAALPWLKLAKAVRVLTALGYQRRGPPAQELAPYLSLHGVAAELATFQHVNGVVGAGLLAAAAEFEADLLATGAYSHSRFRQRILGGVTRHVLGHARLPVLMSR
jgi:nucleotide-binding universal stress UspA family protein